MTGALVRRPGLGPGTHSGECTRAVKPPEDRFCLLEEPGLSDARRGAMPTLMKPTVLVILGLLVMACSSAGGTAVSPTGPSTPSAKPTQVVGAIDHGTGPTDVVLRFGEGGGFVAPSFLATQAPIFTLYGDGTVIFRNPAQDPLPPVGSIAPFRPFRIARLTEDQIQKLLANALGPGGLGTARTDYRSDQIADAPTADFTINAGGITKKVSIYALGIDVQGGPDTVARAAFSKLAASLQDFDQGGSFPTDEFVPALYRGILLEGQPGAPDAMQWPWPTVAPTDFVPDPDPNAFQLPARVMSATEVEALGIAPYGGGFQGLTLIGPRNGKVYSLSLRPLLPDEPK